MIFLQKPLSNGIGFWEGSAILISQKTNRDITNALINTSYLNRFFYFFSIRKRKEIKEFIDKGGEISKDKILQGIQEIRITDKNLENDYGVIQNLTLNLFKSSGAVDCFSSKNISEKIYNVVFSFVYFFRLKTAPGCNHCIYITLRANKNSEETEDYRQQLYIFSISVNKELVDAYKKNLLVFEELQKKIKL